VKQNITSEFIDSLWEFANSPISAETKRQAELCVKDYLACVYMGYYLNKQKSDAMIAAAPDKNGKSRILGSGKRGSIYTAAMVNGFNAHFAELDDGHRYAMMHVGCIIITDIMAMADNYDVSYEQFLKGIVVGYEAAIRLASAMQPEHKLKGYHTTGTCGAIGAAMGIAAMMSYSKEQMNSVLAAVVTSAGGLLEIQEDRSELKPYNASQACVSAIAAALVGNVGYIPPNDILGGNRGLFAVFADLTKIKEQYIYGLGKPAIETVYRKYYAACRHCHSAIEATINCLQENLKSPVSHIDIDTYSLAIKGHDYTENLNVASAKLSMPFSLALAVKYGDVNEARYTEANLEDADLKSLMSQIDIREDAELTALVPAKRAAKATVTFCDGTTAQSLVEFPLGEPENPLSIETIESKLNSSVKDLYSNQEETDCLLAKISDLEHNFKNIE